MKTFRIIRQVPNVSDSKEVLMSGISNGDEEGYNFKPNFELKLIQQQRITYYNDICTEVKDWCFNVTSKKSDNDFDCGEVLMNYRIEEE
jgi:hypothetical protein